MAAGDLRLWHAEIDTGAEEPAVDVSKPLVVVDTELRMVGDGRAGLGVPDSLLVPTALLIAMLRLRPGSPFSYEDDHGVALALVTWRADYEVRDYYLASPRTCGSGIVIRPDLLTKLGAVAGEARLVLRDFVIGDGELADSDAAPLPQTRRGRVAKTARTKDRARPTRFFGTRNGSSGTSLRDRKADIAEKCGATMVFRRIA